MRPGPCRRMARSSSATLAQRIACIERAARRESLTTATPAGARMARYSQAPERSKMKESGYCPTCGTDRFPSEHRAKIANKSALPKSRIFPRNLQLLRAASSVNPRQFPRWRSALAIYAGGAVFTLGYRQQETNRLGSHRTGLSGECLALCSTTSIDHPASSAMATNRQRYSWESRLRLGSLRTVRADSAGPVPSAGGVTPKTALRKLLPTPRRWLSYRRSRIVLHAHCGTLDRKKVRTPKGAAGAANVSILSRTALGFLRFAPVSPYLAASPAAAAAGRKAHRARGRRRVIDRRRRRCFRTLWDQLVGAVGACASSCRSRGIADGRSRRTDTGKACLRAALPPCTIDGMREPHQAHCRSQR